MHACVRYVSATKLASGWNSSDSTLYMHGWCKRTDLVPGQPGLPRQQVLIGVARVPAETARENNHAHPWESYSYVPIRRHTYCRKGPVLRLPRTYVLALAAHYLLPSWAELQPAADCTQPASACSSRSRRNSTTACDVLSTIHQSYTHYIWWSYVWTSTDNHARTCSNYS